MHAEQEMMQHDMSALTMHRPCESFDRQYELVAMIGTGAYGTVYKARDMLNGGHYVAMKRIRLSNSEEGMSMTAIREIALLKHLEKYEHPNIVRLLDVSHHFLSDKEIRLNLVFEFIDQDLSTFLSQCPVPGLGPDRIKDLMLQLLKGVDFLHINRIVHRDLKPQNLLISSNGQLKLADFGLARIYSFNMTLTSVVVTLWYRSPEVLLLDGYGTSVDIWSCGCIFAELFTRKALFRGSSDMDQLRKIFQLIGCPPFSDWPESVSVPCSAFSPTPPTSVRLIIPEIDDFGLDLIEKMLIFKPSCRISAKHALNHPYFLDYTDSVRSSSSLTTSETDSFADRRAGIPVSEC